MTNLSNLSNELTRLSNAINRVAQATVSNMQAAGSSINQNVQSVVTNCNQLWQNHGEKIKAVFEGIKQVVAGVVKAIKAMVKSAFNIFTNGLGLVGSTVSRILSLIGSFGNRVKEFFRADEVNGFNESILNVYGSLEKLAKATDSISASFDSLFNSDTIQKAQDLMSSIFSMENIMGSSGAQGVINWAKSMEHGLGVSATNMISSINELTGVLYGLGMSAEDTALASENMLAIGNYLAMMGAAGGSTEKVMEKLASGMKGETSAVDDLGFSFKASSMNEYLDKLRAKGIAVAGSYEKMNEQARVYLLYAKTIDQFNAQYDMMAFKEALETVTGRVNVLKQTVDSFVTTVGTGLIKVAAFIAKYLIPIIKVLEAQVARFFNWLGDKLNMNFSTDVKSGMNSLVKDKEIDRTTSSTNELGDSVEGVNKQLDKTDKAAKKALGSLMGFDKVNNISTPSSSSSSTDSSDIGPAFDYSSIMNSALTELNEHNDSMLNSYFKELENNLGSKWEHIKSIFEKIREGIYNLFSNIGKDMHFDFILDSLSESLDKALNFIDTALIPNISDGLSAFYKNGIKPLASRIGDGVGNALGILNSKIDELTKWFQDPANSETITHWFSNMGEITGAAGGVVAKAVEGIGSLIANAAEDFAHWLGSFSDDEKKDKAVGFFNKLEECVGKVTEIIQVLWDEVLSPLLADFGEWLTGEGIDWLLETLTNIGTFISENSEAIKDLIEDIANVAWDSFKGFVDVLGNLISTLVQNPEVFKPLILFFGAKALSGGGFDGISNGISDITDGLIKLVGIGVGGSLIGKLLGLGGTGAAAGGAGAAGAGAAGAGAAALGPIAAIAGLVAVIGNLLVISESFRETVSTAFKDIAEAIGEAFSAITGGSGEGGLMGAFRSLKDIFDTVCIALEPLITIMVVTFSQGVVGAIEFVTNTIKVFMDLLTGIFTIIKGGLDVLIGIITGDTEKIKTGIKTMLDGALIAIKGFISYVFKLLTGVPKRVLNIGKRAIEGLVRYLREHGGEMINGLIDGLSKNWNKFKSWISNKLKDIPIIGKIFDGGEAIQEEKKPAPSQKMVSSFGNPGPYRYMNPTQNITLPKYRGARANGGSMMAGQLYLANEAGAEMIGSFDGHSGVATNGMIMKAMESAVYKGMIAANGSNYRGTPMININLGDRQIFTRREIADLIKQLEPYLEANKYNQANRSLGI